MTLSLLSSAPTTQNMCARRGCSGGITVVTCVCGLFVLQTCRLPEPSNNVSCVLAVGRQTAKEHKAQCATQGVVARQVEELVDVPLHVSGTDPMPSIVTC